ncbi:MAG: hypothetical protein JO353_11590 [Phycisphaerae bacterium]|nr:hypothetical protein [Phycisphaerae bacterium]
MAEGTEVTIGGMITRVKKSVTKNGRSAGMTMAMITMEDLDGQMDGVMFAETYADILKRYPNAVANESIGFIKGKIDRRRETPSIVVNDFIPIEEAVGKLTTAMAVKLDRGTHDSDRLIQMKPILQKHKGNIRVYLQLQTGDSQTVIMQLGRDLCVRPVKELVDDLELLFGNGTVQLRGDGARRLKRLEQKKLFTESESDDTVAHVTTAVADEDPASDSLARSDED